MRNSGPQFIFFLLIIAAVFGIACGTSNPAVANCNPVNGSNATGALTSVTLCPGAADAKDYSNGVVPFFATDTYTTQPSPASVPNAFWVACYENAPTTDVIVSSNGSAKCAAGAAGTYDVIASKMTTCNVVTACGGGCQISGSAKLTCP